MAEQEQQLNIPLTPCKSSQIAAHGYDAATQTMALQYVDRQTEGPGPVYHYDNVPADKYQALACAESIGAHFGKHFRNNADYPFRKVRATVEPKES